jgi:hypothetical protein
MGVDFFEDSAEEHRWRVGDDAGIVHSCHEGFKRRHDALQNLFLNHAFMSVFVSGIAANSEGSDWIDFKTGADEKVWWSIKAHNGEIIGKSHKGFDSRPLAVDNLIMTYTMLAMFIALHAQEQNK